MKTSRYLILAAAGTLAFAIPAWAGQAVDQYTESFIAELTEKRDVAFEDAILQWITGGPMERVQADLARFMQASLNRAILQRAPDPVVMQLAKDPQTPPPAVFLLHFLNGQGVDTRPESAFEGRTYLVVLNHGDRRTMAAAVDTTRTAGDREMR
jgi:hypothetical protein